MALFPVSFGPHTELPDYDWMPFVDMVEIRLADRCDECKDTTLGRFLTTGLVTKRVCTVQGRITFVARMSPFGDLQLCAGERTGDVMGKLSVDGNRASLCVCSKQRAEFSIRRIGTWSSADVMPRLTSLFSYGWSQLFGLINAQWQQHTEAVATWLSAHYSNCKPPARQLVHGRWKVSIETASGQKLCVTMRKLLRCVVLQGARCVDSGGEECAVPSWLRRECRKTRKKVAAQQLYKVLRPTLSKGSKKLHVCDYCDSMAVPPHKHDMIVACVCCGAQFRSLRRVVAHYTELH
jgi:hypothetical protein